MASAKRSTKLEPTEVLRKRQPLLGRVALYRAYKRPIVICLSLQPSVGLWSVCPVHCAKTAEQNRMRFGMVGRMGPGMRQVSVGFEDRSTGRGNFGSEFGARHCNQ